MGQVSRIMLGLHIASMVFGVLGLLWVLPNPDFVAHLSEFGMQIFAWGMTGGGAVYIILGAIAVALYGWQTVGGNRLLTFALPAIFLSLGSELLGTSTGFPFGHYAYLEGLGYKIAGLVPFTIPLSWFYMGFVCYLLGRAALAAKGINGLAQLIGGITIGAVLLTAWDFVLDPAMSQASYPFWEFQDGGEFFGMPYRNLTGWLGTGALFMAVASLFWRTEPVYLSRSQLLFPLTVYLVNFAFGASITLLQLGTGFLLPTLLAVVLGVIPAIFLVCLVPATPTSAVRLDSPVAIGLPE
ncbi:MAG: carotenoid biosynthesis protein [Pseudanabaenaceae cyanobacterium SKYGB_i_bin29]|nr:carotenoid biosynthesis protein [Pseudanabaenaceae cyanobacterium SKYG29]MDW8421937.1 carotenoid biosynthesis protein [Pseudanabaenaceae cyanobacterium SKYGB_i_bin29]